MQPYVLPPSQSRSCRVQLGYYAYEAETYSLPTFSYIVFFFNTKKNYVFFALRYKSLTYTRHAYSERPKSSKRNSLRRNRPYITQKLNNQEMGGALTQEMAFHRRCFLRVPAPVFGSRARDASTLEA